jgi:hypothetical protein
MLSSLCFVAAFAVASQNTVNWPTLEQELARHDVPTAGVSDLDHQITSYAVLNDSAWFAIAYYWYEGSSALPNLLRVRVYDKRGKRWKSAVLEGPWGSILHIRRAKQWWYVTGHSSPSAAPTLVLSADLRLVRELKGFAMLVLPDGRLVYHDNMVHFAPAHPGSLSLYNPATDRNVRLFPAKPDEVEGKVHGDRFLVDRTIDEVRMAAQPGRVAFVATEQRIRLIPNGGVPEGPERRLSVTCNLDTVRCSSTPIPDKN